MTIVVRRTEPGDYEAVRLYKKFGFVIEGTLARFAFRDGRYVDVFAMARLR
jgi:putative acetyltransferase